MAISTWLALGVICLLYLALGLWAVTQIFPQDRAATPESDPNKQQERSRT
jgi:cytochrome c-type biogenesis protein CcmH/NrfG